MSVTISNQTTEKRRLKRVRSPPALLRCSFGTTSVQHWYNIDKIPGAKSIEFQVITHRLNTSLNVNPFV